MAIEEAFSGPKWSASFLAMDSVDRRVPYKSNAMTMFFSRDMGFLWMRQHSYKVSRCSKQPTFLIGSLVITNMEYRLYKL